jgi:hypothetical protein
MLNAHQQTIPKAFPNYGLVFAETSGFEDATCRQNHHSFAPCLSNILTISSCLLSLAYHKGVRPVHPSLSS